MSLKKENHKMKYKATFYFPNKIKPLFFLLIQIRDIRSFLFLFIYIYKYILTYSILF